MSIDYQDTSPSEALGYPAMLRVTLERGALAFGDHDLELGAERTYAALAGVDWLTGVQGIPQVPAGASAFVLDVQSTQQGAHNTVGDVATLLDHATYLTRVRSVQRVKVYNPFTDAAAAATARDAATQQAEQQQAAENPLTRAGRELKILAAVAVGIAVLIGWKELKSFLP